MPTDELDDETPAYTFDEVRSARALLCSYRRGEQNLKSEAQVGIPEWLLEALWRAADIRAEDEEPYSRRWSLGQWPSGLIFWANERTGCQFKLEFTPHCVELSFGMKSASGIGHVVFRLPAVQRADLRRLVDSFRCTLGSREAFEQGWVLGDIDLGS